MNSFRKELVQILETQAFDRLDTLINPSIWQDCTLDDRELLARLLVMQGTLDLAQGNAKALESFKAANQISSNHPEILYQQARALSAYEENIACLKLASQILGPSLPQQPSRGWVLYTEILLNIAIFEGELPFFIEAEEQFQQAHQVLKEKADSTLSKDYFYWKWGVCLAMLGKISGEPIDYYQAIEKFRQAYELGYKETSFFNDYGNSLKDLGNLIENKEYFLKALELYAQTVQQNPESFDGWFNQAYCIHQLAEFYPQDKQEMLLDQADVCFSKAEAIDNNSSQLWLKWAELDSYWGRLKRNSQKIESSLIKFSKAYQLEPGHPQILKNWAESELNLAVSLERLDLIQQAKIKILNSIEIQSDDPESWYIYGTCLNELGQYFNDEDYYNQAIEKFQYGLSLERQYPLLWYGLALSYLAYGEMSDQQALYEKAVLNFARMLETGEEGFPQFWNDWGVALLKLGELTELASYVELAIEKFERALKHPLQQNEGEDLDLEWIYNYSCAYDLLGELNDEPPYFEKAIQILTQILQIDSNYTNARFNLALALTHLGEALFEVDYYHKAIDHFHILLEQEPENDLIHLDYGIALIHLAILIHDFHHPEKSNAFFRQAESLLLQAAALGNIQSYYQLAGLYSITEHHQQAMYYLEKAQFNGALPGIEDILHDEWLEGLRQTPQFRQFISELPSRQASEEA